MRVLVLLLVWCSSSVVVVGQRDRFWRHHVEQQSLVVDGVEQYWNLKHCLDDTLSEEDYRVIEMEREESVVGRRIMDAEGEGPVVLVELRNAMTAIHVHAVQTLASCIRQYLPTMSEARAMYIEFDLQHDEGLGGNTPTHMAPIVSIFFPTIVDSMYRTLQTAFDAAGWNALVVRDELLEEAPGWRKPLPQDAGMRASEHLSYASFPNLALHQDGENTAYTLNYAFSGPNDYTGGTFTIKDDTGIQHGIKPDKYSAMVFLGGMYQHGVSQITSGHREMYSTELWSYPDIPIGSNLWTSNADNLKEYIQQCDEEGQVAGTPCNATFSQTTGWGVDIKDIPTSYTTTDTASDDEQQYNEWEEEEEEEDYYYYNQDWDNEDYAYDDYDEREFAYEEEEIAVKLPPIKPDPSISYASQHEQPNFLIPATLTPGQMAPLIYRHHNQGIHGEAFVIGLDPQLVTEFQILFHENGMMQLAHDLLYQEERLEEGEHKVHTLQDGMKWGAMTTDWERNTDMIWLDPANERSFERILSVLRKGNFDAVLQTIGKHFDLKGLMIQGIGAIFLSHFEYDQEFTQLHRDIPNSQGMFYNVIVPIHIPNGGAPFYVGDDDKWEAVQLQQGVGTIVGGETRHGTGECDYRAKRDFRLSFAIYLADISNDGDVDLIVNDATSLWPTEGDAEWFRAQQGRLWNKEGTNSLLHDKGRTRLDVYDLIDNCPENQHLCEEDPTGFRLQCPLTCELYLPEPMYRSLIPSATKPL